MFYFKNSLNNLLLNLNEISIFSIESGKHRPDFEDCSRYYIEVHHRLVMKDTIISAMAHYNDHESMIRDLHYFYACYEQFLIFIGISRADVDIYAEFSQGVFFNNR